MIDVTGLETAQRALLLIYDILNTSQRPFKGQISFLLQVESTNTYARFPCRQACGYFMAREPPDCQLIVYILPSSSPQNNVLTIKGALSS